MKGCKSWRFSPPHLIGRYKNACLANFCPLLKKSCNFEVFLSNDVMGSSSLTIQPVRRDHFSMVHVSSYTCVDTFELLRTFKLGWLRAFLRLQHLLL